jgi:hypothetical protein
MLEKEVHEVAARVDGNGGWASSASIAWPSFSSLRPRSAKTATSPLSAAT